MNNIKFDLSTYVCHALFKKMIKKKDPRQKVGVPQLCRGAINLNSFHLLVARRAWKVQCDNVYIMILASKSFG